jgi:hypothetical protein
MHTYYSLIALDIANERTRDAEMARRARLAHRDTAGRPGFARRGLAGGFARISRGSAVISRRLDVRTADELRRTLAAAK